MANAEMTLEGNILVIKVDLTKNLGLSNSEKSMLIANLQDVVPGTDGVKVGLNVYRPVRR